LQGQIRKALAGFYYVYTNGKTYQTRARGNFRKRKLTPLVGDFVEFEAENDTDGYILELLPRHNMLIRPNIANIDQGIIIMSVVEPNFSTNLLDRFLVTLEKEDISAVIYLSKLDLVTDEQRKEFEQVKVDYEKIGYKVILSSDHSLEEIINCFPKHLSVFMGQSGAGKSTLLNKISPELQLATAQISQSLGRGKHTTRHVELHPINQGLVADTPGFSSIDFLNIEAVDLPKMFPEFVRLSVHCKFRECQHLHEPSCAVKEALETQEILQSRYDNYLQFLDEIKNTKPVYQKKKKGS
jgi:ribosome biogenesis GTPase